MTVVAQRLHVCPHPVPAVSVRDGGEGDGRSEIRGDVDCALLVETGRKWVVSTPGVDQRIHPVGVVDICDQNRCAPRSAAELVQIAHPEVGVDTRRRLREDAGGVRGVDRNRYPPRAALCGNSPGRHDLRRRGSHLINHDQCRVVGHRIRHDCDGLVVGRTERDVHDLQHPVPSLHEPASTHQHCPVRMVGEDYFHTAPSDQRVEHHAHAGSGVRYKCCPLRIGSEEAGNGSAGVRHPRHEGREPSGWVALHRNTQSGLRALRKCGHGSERRVVEV